MKYRAILISFIFIMTVFLSSCNAQIYEKPKNTEKTDNDSIIYAAWLNYNELSMISAQNNNETAFREKAELIFSRCASLGINLIFAHVRAFSDSFYRSEIFPATKYLSGIQGVSVDYDALEIMCEYAQKYGIKIHAWINPYRISYDTDYTLLSENNPARKFLENGDSSTVKITEKGIYYNPSSLTAQKTVLDGVREIIENYPVDGIHIDDYFYPAANDGFDSEEYEAYLKSGGKLSRDNWRRENVNSLIAGIYSLVHSSQRKMEFSVSPSGDIDKNINSYYADVIKWASESGYCDMLIPQLYYGFDNEHKPFVQTLSEWEKIKTCEDVKLVPGLAFYKYGSEDLFAGDGSNEWKENDDIISRQVSEILSSQVCRGFSLYSYSYLFKENNDEICKKELQIIKSMVK